jgi:hypothetical protein
VWLAILFANDLSITLGQWLPYDSHYFGYYFGGITLMLVAGVIQLSEMISVHVSRKTKFSNFEVVLSEQGTEAARQPDHSPLLVRRDAKDEAAELPRPPALPLEDLHRHRLFLQERRSVRRDQEQEDRDRP